MSPINALFWQIFLLNIQHNTRPHQEVTLYAGARCLVYRQSLLDAGRDCNPGHLFESRDFGIEKCQSRDLGIESRDWDPDFELVKISSNSLVLVLWWVLESWSTCWSPVSTYYYVNNCKYFYLFSFLSYDTISPLFNVKRNLLLFINIQDRDVFFGFKVVKIVKFSPIMGPLLLINSSN